jgi:hypothetical protein
MTHGRYPGRGKIPTFTLTKLAIAFHNLDVTFLIKHTVQRTQDMRQVLDQQITTWPIDLDRCAHVNVVVAIATGRDPNVGHGRKELQNRRQGRRPLGLRILEARGRPSATGSRHLTLVTRT